MKILVGRLKGYKECRAFGSGELKSGDIIFSIINLWE